MRIDFSVRVGGSLECHDRAIASSGEIHAIPICCHITPGRPAISEYSMAPAKVKFMLVMNSTIAHVHCD